MGHVMKLHGLATGHTTPWDGQYLKNFDFEARGGKGAIMTTIDIMEAWLFDDMKAVWELYHTQPKCCPLRDDGEPNKPITAFNWEIIKL